MAEDEPEMVSLVEDDQQPKESDNFSQLIELNIDLINGRN